MRHKVSSCFDHEQIGLDRMLSEREGYAITGGQDTVINIFSLASNRPEPSFSLIGHTENVCTLHASPDGTIISGSWDRCARLIPPLHISAYSPPCRSAKVWQNFELLYDLKGHQQSVWAVLILQEGQYLTGMFFILVFILF